jgi:hypothetical protein
MATKRNIGVFCHVYVNSILMVTMHENESLRPTNLVSVFNIAPHFQNLQLVRLFISQVIMEGVEPK